MATNEADVQRYQLQRQNFEKALARLENVVTMDENEVVRDSLIQRFEFTFEMAWKLLFRFLLLKGERVAAKAWDVLPMAFESPLIDDPDTWALLREYRNDTRHEYDQAKAIEVAAFVREAGILAFRKLSAEMKGRE